MARLVKGMSSSQSQAWLALVSLGQRLPAALDRQLADDAGLTNFEYGILTALQLAKEHTMRGGDIAAAMGCPAPRMSKAISRLEKRGLVCRATCQDDGRARNVTLTKQGGTLWRQASRPHVEYARETILGGLEEEQLTALANLLQPVLDRLDPEARFPQTFGTFGREATDATGPGTPDGR